MGSYICILVLIGVIVALISISMISYHRKIFAMLGTSVLACTLLIPILINELYKFGTITGKGYYTLWDAKDVLAFYGSYLAFSGTIALGALVLYQNNKFKKENDKAQLRLEKINNKLLNLENYREEEKLFEIYFSYLDQTQNIFNPEYIIGKPEENRDSISIYYAVKGCHFNILRIKRRLIFLDKSNSDHTFFKFIDDRTSEISNIVMTCNDDGELNSKLFEFWRNYNDDFDTKSLTFMIDIHKSIFKDK